MIATVRAGEYKLALRRRRPERADHRWSKFWRTDPATENNEG